MNLSAPIFRLKRKAKLLSRATNAPLHAALDQVAGQEGFRSWSHLSASATIYIRGGELSSQITPGDLVLLAGRPGHGKTLLGLQLVVEAARAGRQAFYFSLEETESMVSDRLVGLGFDRHQHRGVLGIDTSDCICADYVIERVRPDARDSLVVIDYLQLLDQRRATPPLAIQVKELATFARTASSTVVTVSQIDRSFESSPNPLPQSSDVRLPNPVDLSLFTKSCFLHDGKLQMVPSG